MRAHSVAVLYVGIVVGVVTVVRRKLMFCVELWLKRKVGCGVEGFMGGSLGRVTARRVEYSPPKQQLASATYVNVRGRQKRYRKVSVCFARPAKAIRSSQSGEGAGVVFLFKSEGYSVGRAAVKPERRAGEAMEEVRQLKRLLGLLGSRKVEECRGRAELHQGDGFTSTPRPPTRNTTGGTVRVESVCPLWARRRGSPAGNHRQVSTSVNELFLLLNYPHFSPWRGSSKSTSARPASCCMPCWTSN